MAALTLLEISIVIGLLCGPGSLIFLWFLMPLIDKGVSPVYISIGVLLLIIILLAIFAF